jgi:predicted site-specific integrase-resolvase
MNQLLTKQIAAAKLSVSMRQLELYIRSGQIAVKKLSRRCVRIEETELDRFIEQIGRPTV